MDESEFHNEDKEFVNPARSADDIFLVPFAAFS